MADAALELKLLHPEHFNGTGDIKAYITQFQLLGWLQNWIKNAYTSGGVPKRY